MAANPARRRAHAVGQLLDFAVCIYRDQQALRHGGDKEPTPLAEQAINTAEYRCSKPGLGAILVELVDGFAGRVRDVDGSVPHGDIVQKAPLRRPDYVITLHTYKAPHDEKATYLFSTHLARPASENLSFLILAPKKV